MLEFVAIVFIVLIAWAMLALTAVLLKFVVWLVILPFRLLYAVLALPFMLFRVAR